MVGDPEINYNEEPRLHTTNEGVVWRRTGYCCQCGECCQQCPALEWIGPKRGICSERVAGIKQHCGNDDTWPPSPIQIANYPSCTYKFEMVS